MKRTFLILLLCLPILGLAQETRKTNRKIIYVAENGLGDGSSWSSPLGNLQTALKKAHNGQSIWVAAGTYFPTSSKDRTVAFQIPNGVKVLGGFAGYETSQEERDHYSNKTILSGNIGALEASDNSYTVVFFKGVDNSTILDGFTIEGGNADKKVLESNPYSCGGGIYNDASQKSSSPQIENCTLQNNSAYYGAGLYNNAKGGHSSLELAYCSFISNTAKFDGGAILNEASHGTGNIKIIYSEFFHNQAYYGAALINKVKEEGEANPLIDAVTFEENTAFMKGSPIYNLRTGEGICKPLITRCIFTNNVESISAPKGKISQPPAATQKSYNIRKTYKR
ncbi:MAG TPA: DUF1565 domain-containing protein [Saprospiraceae bacterium]|nr:DUF1565 domain-containing protein [Saprospiraceae bacterium]